MAQDLVLKIITNATDKASAPLKRVQQAAGGLAGNLGRLKTEMAALDGAQAQLSARNGLQQQMKRQSAAIVENRTAQKNLATEISKTGVATKKQVAEMDKLVRNGNRLKKAQADAGASLEKLNTALSRQGIRASQSAQAQAQLDKAYQRTAAAIRREEQALERIQGVQQRAAAAEARMLAKKEALAVKHQAVRQKMQDAAVSSATLAGISMWDGRKARAVGGMVAAPVSAYAESENASVQLEMALMTKGGEVSAQYKEIDKLATRLGDRLPGTTADFKNLMTMLVRQGISAQTILGGTGEAAALLAVQLKLAPEAAAEMAAKLQDATRGSEKEMVGIMDAVQRMFYAGVDANNIIPAFSKLAPALDIMKVSGKEAADSMGPLLGMLDQAGLMGESAGNALRKVFTRMMDAGKVAKATKGKGISLDFTNGKGEFGGMEKMYKELAKLKNATTQQRLEILGDIFGDDAETLQALNTMIDKGQAGYDEFAKKMADQASLNERVNKQLGTLTNLWDAAGGTFINFLASMGEAIAPELKSLIEWVGSVNEKMSIWAKNNPGLANSLMKIAAGTGIFLGVMAVLTGALATLVMPLAALNLAFANFSGGIGMLSAVGRALAWLTTGLLGLGKAALSFLLTNPFGWAVLAVAALGLLWYKWDTVKNAILTGWQWIQTAFSNNPILNFIFPFIGAARLLINNWSSISAFFGSLWGSITTIFRTAVAAISALWQNIKSTAVAALQSLIGYVQTWPLYQWISIKINEVVTFLSSLGSRFYAAGKSMIQGLIDSISDGIAAIKAKLSVVGSLIGSPIRAAGRLFDGNTAKPAGYSVGGYTGSGGVNEAAGIVHKGEVVFSQRDVARFGGWQMVDKIRRGGIAALDKARAIGTAVRQPLSDLSDLGSGLIERTLSALVGSGGNWQPIPMLAGAISPAAAMQGAVSPSIAANRPAAGGNTYHITVSVAAGSNGHDIGRAIADELNRREAAAHRRARGRYQDKD